MVDATSAKRQAAKPSAAQVSAVKLSVENLQVSYGSERVIHGIDLEVREN